MNRISTALVLMLCLCLLHTGVPAVQAETVPLLILHNNDLHGQVDALPTLDPGLTRGGLAALKNAYLHEHLRAAASGMTVLQFDGGDAFQGTPVGDFTRGEAIFRLLSRMGYTTGVPGNHDFDITARELSEKSRLLRYPLLSCNIIDRRTGRTPRFLKPYLLKKAGNLIVGITGVMVEDLNMVTLSAGVKNLAVKLPEKVLPGIIRKMKNAGADLIIVLSHVGIDRDREIAAAVPEIDLLLGAHTHTDLREPEKIGQTLVMQSGSKGQFYTRLQLALDSSTGKIVNLNHKLITVDEKVHGRHQGMQREIDRVAGPIMKPLLEVIGHADRHWVKVSGPISTPEQAADVRETKRRFPWGISLLELSDDKVFVVETNLSQMVTDAFAEATGSPIAITNLTGIRAGKMVGDVTRLDACKILPFENFLYVLEMKGRDVKDLFRQEKKRYRSTFLQVSGLDVEFTIAPDESFDVTKVSHQGKELADDGIYKVCTNNFLASGGDGYAAFSRGKIITRSDILMREALIQYVEKRKNVSPVLTPRLTFRR